MTRLENAYLATGEQPKTKGPHTVIRYWAGGSHTEAKALAADLKLSGKDLEAVIAACPGWNG